MKALVLATLAILCCALAGCGQKDIPANANLSNAFNDKYKAQVEALNTRHIAWIRYTPASGAGQATIEMRHDETFPAPGNVDSWSFAANDGMFAARTRAMQGAPADTAFTLTMTGPLGARTASIGANADTDKLSVTDVASQVDDVVTSMWVRYDADIKAYSEKKSNKESWGSNADASK
jgi:hypothetical protein